MILQLGLALLCNHSSKNHHWSKKCFWTKRVSVCAILWRPESRSWVHVSWRRIFVSRDSAEKAYFPELLLPHDGVDYKERQMGSTCYFSRNFWEVVFQKINGQSIKSYNIQHLRTDLSHCYLSFACLMRHTYSYKQGEHQA